MSGFKGKRDWGDDDDEEREEQKQRYINYKKIFFIEIV